MNYQLYDSHPPLSRGQSRYTLGAAYERSQSQNIRSTKVSWKRMPAKPQGVNDDDPAFDAVFTRKFSALKISSGWTYGLTNSWSISVEAEVAENNYKFDDDFKLMANGKTVNVNRETMVQVLAGQRSAQNYKPQSDSRTKYEFENVVLSSRVELARTSKTIVEFRQFIDFATTRPPDVYEWLGSRKDIDYFKGALSASASRYLLSGLNMGLGLGVEAAPDFDLSSRSDQGLIAEDLSIRPPVKLFISANLRASLGSSFILNFQYLQTDNRGFEITNGTDSNYQSLLRELGGQQKSVNLELMKHFGNRSFGVRATRRQTAPWHVPVDQLSVGLSSSI